MATFAVTGSASGMGAASAAALSAAGHTVIGVDLRDADILADLGTAEGRERAAEEILARCGGTLDGVAAIAGGGPNMPDAAAVMSINYFGTVRLLERLRPALAASGAGRAVVIGSTAASTVPRTSRSGCSSSCGPRPASPPARSCTSMVAPTPPCAPTRSRPR